MVDGPDETETQEILLADDPSKLSEEQRSQIATFEFEGFQSPILPPEVLERYGNVIPGLDKKLVEWVEDETRHRRNLDTLAFEEARTLRLRSSLVGPVVAIFGISVAGLVAVFNPSASGAMVALGIAIVSVGGPFAARLMASRWHQKEDESQ